MHIKYKARINIAYYVDNIDEYFTRKYLKIIM